MNCGTALVRRLVILGILSLVLLAGRGGGTAPAVNNQPPGVTPQATGVTVSPASVTVQTGGAQPFAVIVSPSGANQAVTWSVSGTGCKTAARSARLGCTPRLRVFPIRPL
jgi:Bacterial Ig-like domain (group 2)